MNQCAATGCKKSIRGDMLMCKPHWWKVPQAIRTRIWRGYRHGTADYALAVSQAIAAVEARETPSAIAEQLRLDAYDENGEPHDPVVMESAE